MTGPKADTQFAQLDKVLDTASRDHSLIEGSFRKNWQLFGDPWAQEFDDLLRRMTPDDTAIQAALKGYTEFAVSSMRMQVAFQKLQAYETDAYDTLLEEVYGNEDHMLSEYLPGNLLSHYLWMHHYRLVRFFRSAFLDEMSRTGDRRFHDVGIGTGFYTKEILAGIPGASGAAWDLSEHSLTFADRLLTAFEVRDRCVMHRTDVCEANDVDERPFLISVEVLEHLPDPQAFLRQLHRMVIPGGRVFLTAALNAPHRDHVTLYRDEQQVLGDIRAAGFSVELVFGAYAYPPSKRIPIVPSVAAVIATR